MVRVLRGLFVFVCVAGIAGRTQTPPDQQTAGLESDWDIAAVLQQISGHANRMLPALDQADAKLWVSKGAPEAYAQQLQSSKDQARALADGAKALAANPQVLSAELRVLFREQALETLVGSLAEAMRKYQSPESAQELIALMSEAGSDRDRLQNYAVNLAAEREKDYQVMDQEAQRCRAMVLAPASNAKKKK